MLLNGGKSIIFTRTALSKMMVFKKLTILIAFVVCCTKLHAQLSDNFSDGNFTSSPAWSGNTGDFIVNTSQQLQLFDTVATSGTAYLSTPFSAPSLDNFEWNIYVSQTFAPSSSNNGKVYLVSDQADLSSPLNGYYLQFGEALSLDAVELFRQDGTTSTSICRATDAAIAASFGLRIRVLRDAAGLWELYIDYTGGTTYTLEASGTDATYTSSAHFGVRCVYTSSNDQKFFYDDVYMGPEIVDITPPGLVLATPTSSTTLDVLFDSPLETTSAQLASNYTVDNSMGNPSAAVQDGGNPALVHLTFATSFVNFVTYEIVVDNVADLAANAMDNDTLNFSFFASDTAAYRDVVFNEFLADESPQVGLPAAEFIEIYNRSTKNFDLSGWTLSDASGTATLGSKILAPGAYLILCANADTSDYKLLGPTLGVTSFPSLNNTGDNLTLKDHLGTTVDFINYTDAWYNNPAKSDGGYSIEQINPNAGCLNASNWAASNDVSGGTPGIINSIFNGTPDVTAPAITSYYLNSATQLTLTFSEALDTSATASFLFTVTGGIPVSGFNVLLPDLNTVQINFSTAIDTGITYTLTATNITDCEGNGTGVSGSVDFILAFQALSNEIIINEILFNPTTGVDDFVEIYNNSSKLINLKDWTLANIDNDTVDNHKIISSTDLLLYPGQYYAFTTDKAALIAYYTQAESSRIIELPSLPSYNNDSGTVILINNLNTLSDKFSYVEEDMQFALLQSFDGVSLERMDFNRATQDAGNWHSAAEYVGFATPGYQNSQFSPNSAGDDELSLGSETFSPDNDGYQDVINFNYTFTETGYVGNATIYDSRGRVIRKLLLNELLANTGVFTWNGLSDMNEKAGIGIYVIYFEYFNLSGTVKKIKKSFVLAGKF